MSVHSRWCRGVQRTDSTLAWRTCFCCVGLVKQIWYFWLLLVHHCERHHKIVLEKRSATGRWFWFVETLSCRVCNGCKGIVSWTLELRIPCSYRRHHRLVKAMICILVPATTFVKAHLCVIWIESAAMCIIWPINSEERKICFSDKVEVEILTCC